MFRFFKPYCVYTFLTRILYLCYPGSCCGLAVSFLSSAKPHEYIANDPLDLVCRSRGRRGLLWLAAIPRPRGRSEERRCTEGRCPKSSGHSRYRISGGEG